MTLKDGGTSADCKFREGAEATNSLQLDGVVFEGMTIKATRIGARADNRKPRRGLGLSLRSSCSSL